MMEPDVILLNRNWQQVMKLWNGILDRNCDENYTLSDIIYSVVSIKLSIIGIMCFNRGFILLIKI